jgi:outer membrane protein assembly factor BamB
VAAATPAAPRFVAPRLLWKTFLRRCDSTPVVDDGVIFTGAGSYLYALDNGGRTLWAAETGNQQSSPALGDNDRVYIGSDRGVVYAANRRGGQIAWRFTAGNTILTRPAVGGGRVYAESTDNNVYALDAARGTLRWKFTRPDGSLGYSSPVYTRDGLFVCGESTLYCLDPASGKENWRVPLGGRSLSTPAVGGRRVFVGGEGGDAGISAVSTDGKPLWSFAGKAAGDWFGAPLYAEGTVYVSTYRRYVYALDAATGKPRWEARLLGSALAAPALDAARGVLYVTSATFRDNPTLTALDRRTGRVLWSFRAGYLSESPAVAGDRLYVGSTNGSFFAFDLGRPATNRP